MKNRFFSALLCAALLCIWTAPSLAEAVAGVERPYEVTKKQTTIETKRYRMSIEAGVYIPKSIKEDVELVMDTAEQVTGLTYYPDKPIIKGIGKVRIEVLNPDLHEGTYPAYGGPSGVTVSAPDILIWSGQGWALLHELLHCLQFRNGSPLSPTFAEGFATTHVLEAASTAPFPIALDAYMNYSAREKGPNEKDAQQKFLDLDQTEDGWDNYLYGFPMVLFMNETYGEEAFLKLHAIPKGKYSMSDGTAYYVNHTNKELLPVLLSVTSEDFFTRFGQWCVDNQARLNPMERLNRYDYARFERLDVFPGCYAFNYYDSIFTRYGGSLTLDYTTGNRYLAEYKHITPLGFSGKIMAQGQSTFAFYTRSGELLKTVSPSPDTYEAVTVPDAEVIRITGDGERISVEADFEAMTRAD